MKDHVKLRMGATGFELKDVSAISNNDLGKHDDSSGAKSGANSILLINLITKIVSLSESELAKLSKALTNNNPIS